MKRIIATNGIERFVQKQMIGLVVDYSKKNSVKRLFCHKICNEIAINDIFYLPITSQQKLNQKC